MTQFRCAIFTTAKSTFLARIRRFLPNRRFWGRARRFRLGAFPDLAHRSGDCASSRLDSARICVNLALRRGLFPSTRARASVHRPRWHRGRTETRATACADATFSWRLTHSVAFCFAVVQRRALSTASVRLHRDLSASCGHFGRPSAVTLATTAWRGLVNYTRALRSVRRGL